MITSAQMANPEIFTFMVVLILSYGAVRFGLQTEKKKNC